MDSPDVINQTPPGGNVADPAGGKTYGDGVELDALESALPGLQPGQSSPTRPTPPPMTPRPPQGAMTGLPPALFAPTTQPDIPVSTPLSQPTPVAGTSKEQRIQLADAYAREPSFSQEARDFFARYRDKLIRAGTSG